MTETLRRRVFQRAILFVSATSIIVAALALAQGQSPEELAVDEPSAPKISVKLQLTKNVPDNQSLRSVSTSTGYKGTLVYGDFVPLPSHNGNSWRPFLKQSKTGSTARFNTTSAYRVNGGNSTKLFK